MKTNALPPYDMSDNPTQCCPKFKPESWDEQNLEFKEKLFVKAKTRSLFYMPINMGSIFPKTFKAIEAANAQDKKEFIVMSHDNSMWSADHYFSVTQQVPGQEMVRMNGDYITKVFEGPFRNAPKWISEMNSFVHGKNKEVKKIYFFYTTCPKCIKHYGKNYVVAVAEV